MAPGAKTYEDKVQGLRDLTIDCKLKRLRAKDAAADRAAAELSAKAEAADHARRNRAKNKNPFAHVAVPPLGQGPGTVTIKNGGGQFALAPTIEALGNVILEAFPDKDGLPDGRLVGALGFVQGVAYVMTKQGWLNLGERLSEPEPVEMTNRRGAIAAQRARRGQQ